MNWKGIINVLSVVILICSLAIGLSGFVSLLSKDDHRVSIILIIYSFLLIIFSLIAFYISKEEKHELRTREGFLIVVLCWVSIVILGAIPFYIIENMRFIDSIFETASGFSTTGASIIDSNLILRNGEKLGGITAISKGILFWRSMTHWLGGMGVIVLSIAILPYLGIGGKKLYEAEVSSASSSQLAPRITDTAKILWGVYILMSILQTILLMIGGMSLFDAWCHTCGTISTGGFSTSSASISAFDSFYIEFVIIVFMFLGGSNFVLHHNVLKKGLSVYWKDEEFRSNLIVTLLCGIVLTFIIYGKNFVDAAGRNIDSSNVFSAGRYAFFQVVSIKSATGFCTADFDSWPDIAKFILLILMLVGGCAGSTTGGIKHVRIILLVKYSVMQIKRTLFPHSLSNVTLNGVRVEAATLHKVLAFFFIYSAITTIGALILCIQAENDFITSISAAVSCIGGVGPALAKLGPLCTYSWMSDLSKSILIFLMLLGRLEIFTLVVIFLPSFWKN